MEITGKELQEKINKGEKMIVDFKASWCGPCKVLTPIYEKVAKEHKQNNSGVNFYTIDVDSNRDVVISLGIRSVPTIKSFNGENVVATKVGLLMESQLNELAENLING
jgi:thioredoxin 1